MINRILEPLLPLLAKLAPLKRYRLLLFLAFIVAAYGYLLLQINAATNIAPAASTEVTTARATPHIDQTVVNQLQQLQDNSVSAKALFNQARTNPFQ